MSAATDRLAAARTLLFVGAASAHRMGRAFESAADLVVYDLEDAIAPAEKDAARAELAGFAWPEGEGPLRGVRVNGVGSAEHAADMELVERLGVDLLMLPKAEARDVLERRWPAPLIALIETPSGVVDAASICRSPDVECALFGSIDLGAALGVSYKAGDDALLFARSQIVAASAAAGLRRPFDGVELSLDDEVELGAEARRARALGFGGKACIHPRQLATVAECFAPTEAELRRARGVVAAYEKAEAEGLGVVACEGEMVDAPVVLRARNLLRSHEQENDGN
jgi:citrate lyase subunit beta/citryl-CoA lyase